MSSDMDEQIQRLCREIPEEKDPEKMMQLVAQLNRLLDEKEAAKPNPARSPGLVKDGPEQDISAREVDPTQRKSA